MQIIIKDNIKEMTRWLNDVQRQQIPYAASRALNDVAIDGQNAVIEAIPSKFNNRKRWWLKQQPTGIKVKFSNKKDLHAAVKTMAYFAVLQEKGGGKTPKSSKNLAIPTDRVPKKYRTSHGAKEMMNEKQRMFRTPKGIFKRTGKKTIQVMWTFARSAMIKPRFEFSKTVEAEVKRRITARFQERLRQALASKKPPAAK